MAGKRPYRLGKRKAAVEETKRRIIEAASLEYQENGVEETSMQAVARRADVAPGTVLYHYPTPEDLAEAVVESWIETMEPPTPEAIEEDAPLAERVTALTRELFRLYERTGHLYRVYQKSPGHPSIQQASEWWFQNVQAMLLRALGDYSEVPEAVQVVSVLVNPGFRGTLISTGIAAERTTEIAAQLAIDWLERQES